MRDDGLIPLYSLPSDEWQRQYDALIRDPYLNKKCDRPAKLHENFRYIGQWLPRIHDGPQESANIIDVGPGFGWFMEACRYYGWDGEPPREAKVYGIETPHGEGGMGDAYLRLAELLHLRQQLNVIYTPWRVWVSRYSRSEEERTVWLFNFRGSWEQCYSYYLEGDPHHLHHDASRQRWHFCDELLAEWRDAFRFMASRLVQGGSVLVHANGTDGGENETRYAREVCEAAATAGLKLVLNEGRRLHKWQKT